MGVIILNIGNNIKKYREICKKTQKEIAEVLSVEPATISKYESGLLEPNISSLKKLSSIFNISIDELLSDETNTFKISNINIYDILKDQKNMKLSSNLHKAVL